MVLRAEKCKDNSPSVVICKAGVRCELDQFSVKESCNAKRSKRINVSF